MKKTKISILSPTFYEEDNVVELYERLKKALYKKNKYDYEIIFIDNASTDNTVKLLKELNKKDKRIKIIVNTRNFGHIRSPYWGLLQTTGAATIYLASDLQDPPELMPDFINAWEEGFEIILATKPTSKTNFLFHFFRKLFYSFLDFISDVPQIKNATGFGLYDKKVLDIIRKINDPYPYLRGLINEFGFKTKTFNFEQPRRTRGITKNNFYTLYDIAMLGIISNSMLPIRIASMLGFLIGAFSIILALTFIILKLFFWSRFPIGITPITVGMFFMFGLVLFFIGLLGEYIGSIHTYLKNRPIVIERERVGFGNLKK